jgi:hypothetical protein
MSFSSFVDASPVPPNRLTGDLQALESQPLTGCTVPVSGKLSEIVMPAQVVQENPRVISDIGIYLGQCGIGIDAITCELRDRLAHPTDNRGDNVA